MVEGGYKPEEMVVSIAGQKIEDFSVGHVELVKDYGPYFEVQDCGDPGWVHHSDYDPDAVLVITSEFSFRVKKGSPAHEIIMGADPFKDRITMKLKPDGVVDGLLSSAG